MPAVPNGAKKLREVGFFLERLREAIPSADLTDESVDFYLSAFFAAARSVTFALQAEDKTSYDAWFPDWKAGLSQLDAVLFDLLKDERNQALKVGRTSRSATLAPMLALEYQLKSHAGRIEPWAYDPQATIGVTSYSFVIKDVDRPAVEVCAEGYALLARLVTTFERYPSSVET